MEDIHKLRRGESRQLKIVTNRGSNIKCLWRLLVGEEEEKQRGQVAGFPDERQVVAFISF